MRTLRRCRVFSCTSRLRCVVTLMRGWCLSRDSLIHKSRQVNFSMRNVNEQLTHQVDLPSGHSRTQAEDERTASRGTPVQREESLEESPRSVPGLDLSICARGKEATTSNYFEKRVLHHGTRMLVELLYELVAAT